MNIRYAVSHLAAPTCPKCTHHAGSSMTRSWSRRSSTLATTINNSSKVGPSSCLASRQYSSRSVLPLASSSRGIRRVTSPWSMVHSHSESLRASPLSSPSSWQASRTFATPAQLPENTPIRVVPPTPDSLKTSEEFEDAELIPEKEATLVVTDDAIRQLSKIASREPDNKKLALRLIVESGGCHGYQYKMDLDDGGAVTGDYVLQPEINPCIPIVVDIISMDLLKGSTLHFATELIGSTFRLENNPQAKEGGNCGCGVSWEPK